MSQQGEIGGSSSGSEKAANSPPTVARVPPKAGSVPPEAGRLPAKAASVPAKATRVPPRWFVRLAWLVHRAIYRFTGRRRGLWTPKPGRWGAMRLITTGRRSGKRRVAILGYYEDGGNLVTLAMNGWANPEPAWWMNLQANPDATVDLIDGPRRVLGRAAEGNERTRLWARWQEFGDDIEGYSKLRSTPTAVVVLEPRASA